VNLKERDSWWFRGGGRLPRLRMWWLGDGDQPIKDPKEAKGVKEVQEAAKDAKEVQLMVSNALAHPDSQDGSSSRNWSGFVWLVEFDPGEIR